MISELVLLNVLCPPSSSIHPSDGAPYRAQRAPEVPLHGLETQYDLSLSVH